MTTKPLTGSCECGAVTYEIGAEPTTATACHCSQCRRTSGHIWAAFHVPLDDFRLVEADGLKWYASSDRAKRGFCSVCGSSLFYQMLSEGTINIAPGTLNGPTGLKLTRHIFLKDKGDYYAVADDAEHLEKY